MGANAHGNVAGDQSARRSHDLSDDVHELGHGTPAHDADEVLVDVALDGLEAEVLGYPVRATGKTELVTADGQVKGDSPIAGKHLGHLLEKRCELDETVVVLFVVHLLGPEDTAAAMLAAFVNREKAGPPLHSASRWELGDDLVGKHLKKVAPVDVRNDAFSGCIRGEPRRVGEKAEEVV